MDRRCLLAPVQEKTDLMLYRKRRSKDKDRTCLSTDHREPMMWKNTFGISGHCQYSDQCQ